VRVPESENSLIELNLRKDSPAVGKRVVDLELSAGICQARRRSAGTSWATPLEDRDVVAVITEKEDIAALRAAVLDTDRARRLTCDRTEVYSHQHRAFIDSKNVTRA
jgi:Trk K+ transport system NAD-binding subunit